MLSVPSLVGSGTVVAAATAGLVFGQPTESTLDRPTSHKRKLTADREIPRAPLASSPLATTEFPASADQPRTGASFQLPLQPLGSATTNTTRLPRSAIAHTTPPKASSRRHSFIRQAEWAPPPISEVSRDSISSNGSWMRRLSIRPLSQHGSPRSSVALDSPSVTFSHGSAAPILSPSSLPQSQPRNKLVKRTTAGQDSQVPTLTRRGSRSFRRPATSHQRSATLQQFQHPPSPAVAPASLQKHSLDQQIRPEAAPMQIDIPEYVPEPSREPATAWSSFFHSRISKAPGRAMPPRSNEGSPSNYPLPNRRIHLRQGSLPRAYLITTSMMTTTPPSAPALDSTPISLVEPNRVSKEADEFRASPQDTPAKRARRSISMHFSSPGNWISRTGSLRRPKRGSESKGGGTRHVSAPMALPQNAGHGDLRRAVEDIFTTPSPRQDQAVAATGSNEIRTRQRNSSSPLPPLSRLSSFNVDLSRLAESATSGTKQPLSAPGGSFPPQAYLYSPHSRDASNDRASTLAGSDLEMRGFGSGDDDDTDFKSETMFDSLRTAGSSRLRAVETPLESMFDESPPSTASNTKTKRLSIQEILGRSWDADTKIMEEDEGAPTPIRGAQSSHENAEFDTYNGSRQDALDFDALPANFSLANRDFGRLSLDDDDDDDWARMDENGLTNHLSPPSSSVNSRGVSPNLRMALANISGNGSPESFHQDVTSERPRSNVFDWSEPAAPDKFEAESPRPKTVHGKQEIDVRGGRSASRKGPTAAHVRSQSVPVIPDLPETTKASSKFGTWASGPKNASEDWEADFDFEMGAGPAPQGPTASFSMKVPESIRATQPTVKAHSGQIREFSLLVNGLKRLCRHGRDLDIVDESPSLWKEAENIIALASPDEEAEHSEDDRPKSLAFDPHTVDDRYLDEGFDAGTLQSLEDPFEMTEPEIPKIMPVRDRPSGRRQSVFSPEDDIFGGSWPLPDNATTSARPQTPDRSRALDAPDSAMIASIMEAMQKQRSSSVPVMASPIRSSKSELFFNTNTLQELVKRANTVFHALSDIVRRAELLTQSPACTPRHERHHKPDVSPAFTRVFTDPSSPPKRLPKSHSTNSVLSRSSIDASSSGGGMGQRLHMMTVN